MKIILWSKSYVYVSLSSKSLEIEIPFDPAIPLLGIYPKDYKSFYYKDTCMHMFIAAVFTIATICNQSKCLSMIDWTRNMLYINTIEYYAAIKIDEFLSFVGTLGESGNHNSQQSDTRIENQTLHLLTYRQVSNNENA